MAGQLGLLLGRSALVITKNASKKYIQKTQRGNNVYKIIYSGFLNRPEVGCKGLKIKVRPAGLEPATLCLEGRCSIL
jgi:hypothetical protein